MIKGQAVEKVECKVQFLNVIFHGPFNFLIYEHRIEVTAIDTDEHLFGAGTFLEEKPITTGSYTLRGVPCQSQMHDPDPDRILIMDANKVGLYVPKTGCYKFILPPAHCITPYALMKVDPSNLFVGDYAPYIKVDYLGAVHAVTYCITPDDVAALNMEDVPWDKEISPWFPQAINLHVFAEAAFARDITHAGRDFDDLVSMCPELSLGLRPPFPIPEVDLQEPSDDCHLGITKEEQVGLRGLRRPPPVLFNPPAICDSPSMVVVNATDNAALRSARLRSYNSLR